MAAQRQRKGGTHHRCSAGLHRRNTPERAWQSAGYLLSPGSHGDQRRRWRGGKRRACSMGERFSNGFGVARDYGYLHGRRLSAGDEDHGHVVSRRSRCGDGNLNRCSYGWFGNSYLIRGATELPWRQTLLASSLLALLSCAVILLLVRDGPFRFPPARFDIRMAGAIFRERGLRLTCFGYFGHMWELHPMWALHSDSRRGRLVRHEFKCCGVSRNRNRCNRLLYRAG